LRGKDGSIAYKEIVAEVPQHPDYEKALKAVWEAARAVGK